MNQVLVRTISILYNNNVCTQYAEIGQSAYQQTIKLLFMPTKFASINWLSPPENYGQTGFF